MTTRFKMVVAVHLFLIKDNKILLSRRFNTGYCDGMYSLPAGHVDENESCIKALLRETKEEIGLELNKNQVKFAHVMHRNEGRESVDFFFSSTNWVGQPSIQEKDKCDDLSWFNLNELPINTILYIKQAIELYLQQQSYSEFAFDI